MMGAGKTTVGRLLARHLGKLFYDCDHEIEARTGVRVSVIFEIEGEQGFRKREAEELRRLAALDQVVLATGGGAVLDSLNRTLLTERGFVIYLHALPKDLWHRTRHDNSRPLLDTPDPRTRVEELYRIRDSLYREVADLVVDTGRQSVNVLVKKLLTKLGAQCKLSA
ncbi:MAG: shikimate kinase [Betaproteobacteria bacterium RIFCSPLOWO2_12_FULL_63_13]|nr:MAG: shikimate kinase [Betaproteobacteria bacterium RIFCSPLOWO2_12_FULL_63_13]